MVGGLPVTCNLTLPVACVAKAASNNVQADGPRFEYEYSKYNGWPEIKESLMSGRIQAGYMLAPLVMDLADKGIPVKIVSLGHRSERDFHQGLRTCSALGRASYLLLPPS